MRCDSKEGGTKLKKRDVYEVIDNCNIAKDVYKMILKGDTQYIFFPGQFLNIQVNDLFLRRPISVCDYDEETITIIYKVVGHGTEGLSKKQKGDKLDVLTGLGNGYNVKKCEGDKPLLIGGGVGTPPMYRLCKKLLEEGKNPTVILGSNSKEDVFFENEFKDLGVEVHITTVDGSYGMKGFVTDVMRELDYSYFYACGPMPMMKAVYNESKTNGEFSLEAKMGCGFGACMGCTIETKNGYRRICKEGPVFKKEELLW